MPIISRNGVLLVLLDMIHRRWLYNGIVCSYRILLELMYGIDYQLDKASTVVVCLASERSLLDSRDIRAWQVVVT